MIINGLPVLPAPAAGDEIPIERGTTTYKIDYATLAAAIVARGVGASYSADGPVATVNFAGTTKSLCSVSIPPGVYIITATARFGGATAGKRQGVTVSIGGADGSFNSDAYTLLTAATTTAENQYYNATWITERGATSDIHCMGFDTVARTVVGFIRAIKIR